MNALVSGFLVDLRMMEEALVSKEEPMDEAIMLEKDPMNEAVMIKEDPKDAMDEVKA